jgi:hypothetical protein
MWVVLSSSVSSGGVPAGPARAPSSLLGFGGGADSGPTETGWYSLDPEPLLPPSAKQGPFGELLWLVSNEGPFRSAERKAGDWLGLDELEVGVEELRLRGVYGKRLTLTSFTGYELSSQREVRVDYSLGAGLLLRSETRERGESALRFLKQVRFW